MTPIALESPHTSTATPVAKKSTGRPSIAKKPVKDISYANFITTIAVSYLLMLAVTLTGCLLLAAPELFSIDPQAVSATITARVSGGIMALLGVAVAYLSHERLWDDRINC